MDTGDKIAAAVLAASRCAAAGTHALADYFAAYAEMERLFAEHRRGQATPPAPSNQSIFDKIGALDN